MWVSAIIIILMIVFSLYSMECYYVKKNIKDFNNDKIEKINKYALPLYSESNKYIELQTEKWIKLRSEKKPCYAVLEKDKIVMAKWMKIIGANTPKIHYYAYHDEFNYDDLKRVVQENNGKKMIIKISHLQSNYGVILVPIHPSEKELLAIYNKCLKRFNSSFVCNHDKNDPPTNQEISEGKKSSYYKLYETIKPGIIIQDFFYSYKPDDRPTSNPAPDELKILLFGNKIVGFGNTVLFLNDIYANPEKYRLVFEEAKRISTRLGASFIRVDIFIKYENGLYVPYLNEISLSPNSGLRKAWLQPVDEINKIKKEIENAPHGNYEEIDKLIEECPYREIPISDYLTDAESVKEKYYSSFAFW